MRGKHEVKNEGPSDKLAGVLCAPLYLTGEKTGRELCLYFDYGISSLQEREGAESRENC